VRENRFRSKELTPALQAQGALVYPVIAGMHAPAGYPDTVVWHPLWCGWIEAKAETTVTEVLQWVRIEELNRRVRGSACVVRRVGDGQVSVQFDRADTSPVIVQLDGLLRLLSAVWEPTKERARR
jgi:hypothetical protein